MNRSIALANAVLTKLVSSTADPRTACIVYGAQPADGAARVTTTLSKGMLALSMRKLRRVLALGVILCSATSHAAPIVVVKGQASDPSFNQTGYLIGTSAAGEQLLATSWSASGGYTNVSISALLSGAFRFDAHLMRAIGPGTTVGDQVATATLDIDVPNFMPAEFELFSGLILAPGDYFLVLDPVIGSSGNWWTEFPHTVTLDTGAALGLSYLANDAGIDATFAPASAFVDLFPSLITRLSFSVTGDPATIPEPTTTLLVLGALAALVLTANRRRASPAGR